MWRKWMRPLQQDLRFRSLVPVVDPCISASSMKALGARNDPRFIHNNYSIIIKIDTFWLITQQVLKLEYPPSILSLKYTGECSNSTYRAHLVDGKPEVHADAPRAVPWGACCMMDCVSIICTHRIHGAGIYANIWGILMVNVTIYNIHGFYHMSCILQEFCKRITMW